MTLKCPFCNKDLTHNTGMSEDTDEGSFFVCVKCTRISRVAGGKPKKFGDSEFLLLSLKNPGIFRELVTAQDRLIQIKKQRR